MYRMLSFEMDKKNRNAQPSRPHRNHPRKVAAREQVTGMHSLHVLANTCVYTHVRSTDTLAGNVAFQVVQQGVAPRTPAHIIDCTVPLPPRRSGVIHDPFISFPSRTPSKKPSSGVVVVIVVRAASKRPRRHTTTE